MIATIERYVRASARELGTDHLDPRVLDAMRRVPRHEFVPDALADVAYDDRPLPIGHGQTISQPFIVALMSHLARIEPDHRVLEVGTGSGYQAAVLAELAHEVRSIEVVPELAASASKRLARLGYANVEVRCGDGYAGWPEAAPFDAIVVTAAAPHVPPALVEQLRVGGTLVIPVGEPYAPQRLEALHKHDDAHVTTRNVLPVAFVPLVHRRAGD
ncbi:MAG: protein-L-isoaspartate(D-aspartate) O-methyltransferase [bacterium]